MSDENTNQPGIPVNDNTGAASTKVDKGTHSVELVTFNKGEKEGFKFYLVQYNTLDAAFEKFGQGDVNKGKELVLGLVNTQLGLNLRNKASSRMPDEDNKAERDAAIKARLEKGDVLLISEAEAESYVPGTREKTSPASILRQIKEAQKEGNTELAAELLANLKDKIAEMEASILG